MCYKESVNFHDLIVCFVVLAASELSGVGGVGE